MSNCDINMVIIKYLYIDKQIIRRNICCETYLMKNIFQFGILWERFDAPWLRYLRIYLPFFAMIITFNDMFYKKIKLYYLNKNKWFGPFYKVQDTKNIVLASKLLKYGLDSKNYGFAIFFKKKDFLYIILSPFYLKLSWNIQ